MAEHVFTPEDIPAMVRELIDYCKKWGLWRDASVCAGGKRYSHYTPEPGPAHYDTGGLLEGYDDVWVENLPDEDREWLLSSPIYDLHTGRYEFVSFCNPEQLLDMTFEGPLYDLVRQTWYRTEFDELSPEGREEVMKLLFDRSSKVRCEVTDLGLDVREEAMSDAKSFMKRLEGWDPMEFDSYEEYLELADFEDPFYGEDDRPLARWRDFTSREEMQEALEMSGIAREEALFKAFLKKELSYYADGLTIIDCGALEARVYDGFLNIFKRYGLRYNLCTGTTLTAYRS